MPSRASLSGRCACSQMWHSLCSGRNHTQWHAHRFGMHAKDARGSTCTCLTSELLTRQKAQPKPRPGITMAHSPAPLNALEPTQVTHRMCSLSWHGRAGMLAHANVFWPYQTTSH